MTDRIGYLQQLLEDLHNHCNTYLESDSDHSEEAKSEFREKLSGLSDAVAEKQGFTEPGQELLCEIVSRYPNLTPSVHRDLFWLFGGDCLHYLSDDEIERYQQLEDRLYEAEQAGEELSFQAARADVFNLH